MGRFYRWLVDIVCYTLQRSAAQTAKHQTKASYSLQGKLIGTRQTQSTYKPALYRFPLQGKPNKHTYGPGFSSVTQPLRALWYSFCFLGHIMEALLHGQMRVLGVKVDLKSSRCTLNFFEVIITCMFFLCTAMKPFQFGPSACC